MKTSSKKLNTSVEITVNFTKSDLEPARLKALERLANGTKVAGFRKGKAPANVVEQHVDPNDLASETLDIAIRGKLPAIFQAEKIQPLSMPQVNIVKYVPGEMAEFTVTSDIMPEVKLGNYKKLKAKREKVEVKAADVTDVLERIAKSYAEPRVVKRKSKKGDEVIIDFAGKKDGVVFEGGSAKDFRLALGSGEFIPGFEDGVIGHEAGDKFELDLTFPKEYHNQDLAGAKTVFEVLVKQVNDVEVPKIDDELAKKSGAFETLKELKADIKKNLVAQAEKRAEDKYRDGLVMELVTASTVEAPQSVVADQLSALRQDLEQNVRSRGATVEEFLEKTGSSEEKWNEEARKIAEDRVKASIILQELAKELDVKVDDAEVAQKVAELKEVYKKDENAAKQLEDERVIADIANRLKIDRTLEKLAKFNA
ncbi:MAG: trigger factor [Candidatus Nomurabacteria bacterium]|jgi:trigger factor|nr:trigger factor [Candidatus Nomurabacteria bacterium]